MEVLRPPLRSGVDGGRRWGDALLIIEFFQGFGSILHVLEMEMGPTV